MPPFLKTALVAALLVALGAASASAAFAPECFQLPVVAAADSPGTVVVKRAGVSVAAVCPGLTYNLKYAFPEARTFVSVVSKGTFVGATSTCPNRATSTVSVATGVLAMGVPCTAAGSWKVDIVSSKPNSGVYKLSSVTLPVAAMSSCPESTCTTTTPTTTTNTTTPTNTTTGGGGGGLPNLPAWLAGVPGIEVLYKVEALKMAALAKLVKTLGSLGNLTATHPEWFDSLDDALKPNATLVLGVIQKLGEVLPDDLSGLNATALTDLTSFVSGISYILPANTVTLADGSTATTSSLFVTLATLLGAGSGLATGSTAQSVPAAALKCVKALGKMLPSPLVMLNITQPTPTTAGAKLQNLLSFLGSAGNLITAVRNTQLLTGSS